MDSKEYELIMNQLANRELPRHEWLDPQPPRDRDKEMNQWVKKQGNPTITPETEEINYQGESGEFINQGGDRISYELQDPSHVDKLYYQESGSTFRPEHLLNPQKSREASVIDYLKKLEGSPFMELQKEQDLEEEQRVKDWYNKSEMYGY